MEKPTTVKQLSLANLGKQLEAGDIISICEKGLQHSFARIVQRTKWHHVMLYKGNGLVLEVTPKKGCSVSKLKPVLLRCIEFKVLRTQAISGKQKEKMLAKAEKKFLGMKFSTAQTMKIALFRELPFWTRPSRPANTCDTSNVICSNMIAMAYWLAGVQISKKFRPEYAAPRDFGSIEGFRTVLWMRQQQPL